MGEGEEYDSDSTVLLTDFANKPRKIDVKRRRLSNVQNKSKKLGQQNENTVTNAENIKADSSNKNSERNWRITKYFSCNDTKSNTNIRKNISSPKHQTNAANDSKRKTANMNDNDIVCLDSDDEIQNDERIYNTDMNTIQNSSVIDNVNRSRLTVLLPAAINARRATTDVFERDEMHTNRDVSHRREANPVRLRVLEPATINARRATTHFETNHLASSLSNENNNQFDNAESEKNKTDGRDSYGTVVPIMPQLHTTVANTVSDTSSDSNNLTGARVETKDVKTVSCNMTVTNNSLNTDICHNITNVEKDFQQATVSNNVSNIRKRFSDKKETQIESKRIKSTISTVLNKKIELGNDNPGASKVCETPDNEKHVICDENDAINKKICEKGSGFDENNAGVDNPRCGSSGSSTQGPPATPVIQNLTLPIKDMQSQPSTSMCPQKPGCPMPVQVYATVESNIRHEEELVIAGTFNKVCEERDENIAHNKKQEESIMLDEQDINKVQAEQGKSEESDKKENKEIPDKQVMSLQLLNQETIHAKDNLVSRQVQDEQDASNPCDTGKHEMRNASKGPDEVEMAEVQAHESGNATSEVIPTQSIDETFDQHQTGVNQNEIITNEEQRNGHSCGDLDKTIASVTNENQNTSEVISNSDTIKANVESETYKLQNTCHREMMPSQVINTKDTSKIDTTISTTTNDEQETEIVQNEPETTKLQHKQFKNEVTNQQEMNMLQDTQTKHEAINTENVSTVQNKNLTSTLSEQETQQLSNNQTNSESCTKQVIDQQIKDTSKTSINSKSVEGNESMKKFQCWFFTKVVENLTEMQNNLVERNPEFATILQIIIETFNLDSINENETNVQYKCPKCSCVSNFSSSLMDNTDDESCCNFCRYIRKLHTTYLKRYFNKKFGRVSNKKKVKSSLTENNRGPAPQNSNILQEVTSIQSKIPVEESNNDPSRKPVVDEPSSSTDSDNSTLTVNKTDNLTSTQNCLEKKTENHNVLKELKIKLKFRDTKSPNYDILLSTSENNPEISKTFGEVSIEKDSYVEEMVNQDTPMGEEVSTKNNLIISKKRPRSEIDEQVIVHKRIKGAAENNNTEQGQNLNINFNSQHPTTFIQGVIENNKKRHQSIPVYADSAEEPKNKRVTSEESIMPENIKNSVISPVAVTGSSHEDEECSPAVNSGLNTSKHQTSNESPTETHTNTIDTNTQVCLESKGNSTNVITADTVESETKSDDNGKEVSNEIDQFSQRDYIVEIEENYKSIKTACEKPVNDTIPETDLSQIDAEIRNTNFSRDNEHAIKSLVNCFTQLQNNNNTGEAKKLNEQRKHKTSPKPTSKQNVSTDKLLSSSTTYKSIVVKYKYTCPDCASVYTHARKLLSHLKNKHNSELTKIPEKSIMRQCPFCKMLLRIKNYNQHVQRCCASAVENGNNESKSNVKNIRSRKSSESTKFTYQCAVCNTTFTTDYAARLHRQQVHPELKHKRILKRIQLGDKERDIKYNQVQDKQSKRKTKRSAQTNKPQEEKETDISTEDDDDNENTSTDEDNYSNTSWESEDWASDATDVSSQRSTNSEITLESCRNGDVSSNEDEDSSDGDESSLFSDKLDVTSGTSDNENDDKCDKNKTKTLREEVTSTCNDKPHNLRNRKNIFKCILCNNILYSAYATRKHRVDKHPNMLSSIFSKIKRVKRINNEPKLNRETVNYSTKVDNDSNAHTNENTSDSDWSTVSDPDCFDKRSSRSDSGQYTNDTEIEDSSDNSGSGARNETASEEETIKPSHNLLKKRRDRVRTLLNEDSHVSASRKKRYNVRKNRQHSKTVRAASDRKHGKRLAVVKKFTENRESDDNDWIVNTGESSDEDSDICDSQNTDSNKSDEDVRIAKEAGDDETLKVLTSTVNKRRQALSKFFGDDNDSDAEDSGQQVINELLSARDNSDNQTHSHKNTTNNYGNEVNSDDETIKVSETTLKKRKQRISIMFDDGDQNLAQDKNSNVEKSNSRSKENEASQNNRDCDESPVEKPELRKGETNSEKLKNVAIQQNRNEEARCSTSDDNCDMGSVINPNNSTKNSKNSNTNVSSNANVELSDEDRIEIELINRVLEEYNALSPEDQRSDSCVEKEKDANYNIEPNVTDDQSDETNIYTKDTQEFETMTNCIDNLQISNVRSIASKLVIFICQECSFATDTYDDAIRHCQNHYNGIQDPVTYCNICQISYGTSCFERHQKSHDKYVVNIKIKYSFKWLFSNWQQLFDTKLITLKETEEIQVKSIYKNHCVKMTVKEDGSWQSALYMCAKCNACVPVRDIEKHVQQCTFEKYPCSLCNRVFSTHEIREHHMIYHEDGVTQRFKTIVFNEESDESFNSNLFQAKLQIAKNKEKLYYIYKCLCGLCFNTLKTFKMHFVDCDSHTNDGIECTKCSGSQRFLPSDLKEHLSLHGLNGFIVQRITFQPECEYNSSELESVITTEMATDNATQVSPNDANMNSNRDILKNGILQDTSNIVDQDSERLVFAENALRPISLHEVLNIDQDVLKNELLSQKTNQENDRDNINIDEEDLNNRDTEQIMSIANDIIIKRDLLKDELVSQNRDDSQEDVYDVKANIGNKSTIENVTHKSTNDEDLHIKKDMLKDESLSLHLNEINTQENISAGDENVANSTSEDEGHNDINQELNIKNVMLKEESFSQNTVDKSIEKTAVEKGTQVAMHVELNIKQDMLKNEPFSQNTIDKSIENNNTATEHLSQIAINEDFNIKQDMLKKETLSQNTNIECTRENLDIVNEDLNNETVANDITTIMSIDDDTNDIISIPNSLSQENSEEKNHVNKNSVKGHSANENDVILVVDSDVIVIQDSDDDDIKLIE